MLKNSENLYKITVHPPFQNEHGLDERYRALVKKFKLQQAQIEQLEQGQSIEIKTHIKLKRAHAYKAVINKLSIHCDISPLILELRNNIDISHLALDKLEPQFSRRERHFSMHFDNPFEGLADKYRILDHNKLYILHLFLKGEKPFHWFWIFITLCAVTLLISHTKIEDFTAPDASRTTINFNIVKHAVYELCDNDMLCEYTLEKQLHNCYTTAQTDPQYIDTLDQFRFSNNLSVCLTHYSEKISFKPYDIHHNLQHYSL